MQWVAVKRYRNVFLRAGMNEAPALYLTGSHVDLGNQLTVYRRRARAKKPCFDHSISVVSKLLKNKDLFSCLRDLDLRQNVEIAVLTRAFFDDQCACHAAGELKCGRAMHVRVVPERAGGMFLMDMDPVFLLLPRSQLYESVVAFKLSFVTTWLFWTLRCRIQAVRMKVGDIEIEMLRVPAWCGILRMFMDAVCNLWHSIDKSKV